MVKKTLWEKEHFLLFPQCFLQTSFSKYLPNDKTIKEFADDDLNVAKMAKFVFNRVGKHCGKGRICWSPAFSPFPTFSTNFFSKIFKTRDCAVKTKVKFLNNG